MRLPRSSSFFCFLDGGPSLSSQTFFRFSISLFLTSCTPFRVSSGMIFSTPYLSAMGFLTVQGLATAASRSTQSLMNRRSIDFEKERRSRLKERQQIIRKKLRPSCKSLHLIASHCTSIRLPPHFADVFPFPFISGSSGSTAATPSSMSWTL